MKNNKYAVLTFVMMVSAVATGCWGGRYISADQDLESIYVGKSYYDIEADFGRPDATMKDGMGGTKMAYDSVSLAGTTAAELYSLYSVKNKVTGRTGRPSGGITFLLNSNNRCYAVDSDFQRERIKESKARERMEGMKEKRAKLKFPRSIDFPYYSSCSPAAECVSIEKVEVDRQKTKVYFVYQDRTPVKRPVNDIGVYVMPEVYIEDCATHKRYALLDVEGITFYPERTQFAHNDGGYDVLVYSLTFEAVGEKTRKIDIVEPGHTGFNFYGVDIVNPNTSKSGVKVRYR